MQFAVIIPARGGSKRLPGKNLLKLGNHSLVGIAITQGRHFTENIYVTTDCEEIATEAIRYGAEVINRPAHLATDTAYGIDVVKHAVNNIDADCYVYLHPTTPFRNCKMLKNEIDIAISCGFDNGLTLTRDDRFIWKNNSNNFAPVDRTINTRPRSQDKQSNYIEDGSCYFFKKTVLNRNDYIDNNCAVLTGCFGVDIDTPDDYALALKLWSNIWL